MNYRRDRKRYRDRRMKRKDKQQLGSLAPASSFRSPLSERPGSTRLPAFQAGHCDPSLRLEEVHTAKAKRVVEQLLLNSQLEREIKVLSAEQRRVVDSDSLRTTVDSQTLSKAFITENPDDVQVSARSCVSSILRPLVPSPSSDPRRQLISGTICIAHSTLLTEKEGRVSADTSKMSKRAA